MGDEVDLPQAEVEARDPAMLSRCIDEELLLPQSDLIRITALRQVLHPFTPIDAMEFVLKHMRPTASNAEFLGSMNR